MNKENNEIENSQIEDSNDEKQQLQQLILDHVLRDNYQPVKPKIICKKIGRPREDLKDVRRAIKRLVKSGQLKWDANHIVRRGDDQKTRTPRITGVYSRAAAGFGFVRPTGTPPALGRDHDIFIPPGKELDAADGDVVEVKTGQKPGDSEKVRGQIVDVLQRNTHRFVGTYFEREGAGFVAVDAGKFAEPIYVGDAGAKNAASRDKVVIDMVRFPSRGNDGEAVIVEVLGARGEPGVDTLSIIHEFGLPGEFSEEVMQDARAQADAFDESLDGREDLTEVTTITIDPVDARDFDDAISLSRIENGHWRLGVHIADVSHFVKLKTHLDDEARDRATSIYLPDRVIPMLPEIISNNLASLQPGKVRYTKTAFIEFTPEGTPIGVDVVNGAIRSDHRFAYEEIDEYLADRAPWQEKLSPEVFKLVGEMHELAMILRKRRFEKGALELSLPEVKIDLDSEGQVSGAHTVENTESHQIIEEFMLAANIAVAVHLRDKELNFIRRIHQSPARKKLQALNEFVQDMGIQCENLEDRFEIQRVINEVAGRPEARAVNYAVLRAMKKAIYSPEDEGHYALSADTYCHFTSPIRRYPDLDVHRMIDALIAGTRPRDKYDKQMSLAEHCSGREQRAEQAERELKKLKLLNYLATRKGDEMEGVITGVEEFGLFVQGLEIPAEGLIPVASMIDDYYTYDRRAHSLTGKKQGNSFRLGDTVKVRITLVEVDRRQLEFRLVEKLSAAPRTPKPVTHKPASRKSSASKPEKGKPAKGKPSAKAAGGKPRKKKVKAVKKRTFKKRGKKK